MRKLGIVVTAIACLMVSAVAFAADAPAAGKAAGAMTFGVDGGIAVPTGDYGDVAKMGFTGGVFGEYGINEMFAIGIGADYVKISAKDDVVTVAEAVYSLVAEEAITAKLSTSIIPILAYAKWTPPMKDSKVAPYIMAGGGFYMMKAKSEFTPDPLSLNGDTSENKAGFFGGVGVDFKASPQVKVGVFGKFHDVLTDVKSTMFMTAGVSVGFGLATK